MKWSNELRELLFLGTLFCCLENEFLRKWTWNDHASPASSSRNFTEKRTRMQSQNHANRQSAKRLSFHPPVWGWLLKVLAVIANKLADWRQPRALWLCLETLDIARRQQNWDISNTPETLFPALFDSGKINIFSKAELPTHPHRQHSIAFQ